MIIQQHFQGLKSRALATGLATAGLDVGFMAFSPITRLLLDHYGWRGAAVMIAGCSLQILVAAALFRPARIQCTDITNKYADTNSNDKGNHKDSTCSKVHTILKGYFNTYLLKHQFILVLIAAVTVMIGIDSMYIRSVARAESVGIDPFRASLIMTFGAACGVVGRVIGGVIARWMSPYALSGVGLISGGVSICLSALLAGNNYFAHVFFCSWFALSNGELP